MAASRDKGHLSFLANLRWETLVAGVTAGGASTIALHPLDLVKIRFQVNEGTGVTQRPSYRGLIDAFSSIFKSSGVRGLYQGLTPNLVGASASWGLYFFFYQALKSRLQQEDSTRMLSAPQHMLAASEAGVLTLLITNPVWVTKTRLCLQYDTTGARYRGMLDALGSIWRTEGMKGLYRGLLPGLLGVSHGVLQFTAYEEMKNRYHRRLEQAPTTKLSTSAYLTFSALSKIFAASTTYPYQVVRSRLQDQHRNYAGVVDVVKQTWTHEGLRGFYKGLLPSLLRVTPACCITFVVYENLVHWLTVS